MEKSRELEREIVKSLKGKYPNKLILKALQVFKETYKEDFENDGICNRCC